MWKRHSLRTRIFLLLIALVCTTLLGGLVTLWHTRAMDSLLGSLIDQNLTSFQAAEELEASLLQQKGYLTYFFLDGNPDWLKQMEQHQQAFAGWLQKARRSAYTEAMQDVVRQIDTGYQAYAKSRQEVIELYQRGERQAGARRHGEARRQFAGLLNLCERYKLMHEYAISRARTESETQARLLNTFALVALPGVTILGPQGTQESAAGVQIGVPATCGAAGAKAGILQGLASLFSPNGLVGKAPTAPGQNLWLLWEAAGKIIK